MIVTRCPYLLPWGKRVVLEVDTICATSFSKLSMSSRSGRPWRQVTGLLSSIASVSEALSPMVGVSFEVLFKYARALLTHWLSYLVLEQLMATLGSCKMVKHLTLVCALFARGEPLRPLYSRYVAPARPAIWPGVWMVS